MSQDAQPAPVCCPVLRRDEAGERLADQVMLGLVEEGRRSAVALADNALEVGHQIAVGCKLEEVFVALPFQFDSPARVFQPFDGVAQLLRRSRWSLDQLGKAGKGDGQPTEPLAFRGKATVLVVGAM